VTFEQYATACGLSSLLEVDKVCHLAYFHLKTQGTRNFTLADASRWLASNHFATPNRSRLEGRLRESHNAIRSNTGFMLAQKFIDEMDQKYPALSEKSQDVIDEGTILPEADYGGTRGYVESIAKQINAAYEQNIFDGCAVLMRRLVEILLILSYRNLGIEAAIKDPAGNYSMLDGIITDAKNNPTLSLSRNGKGTVEKFRQLGNFSAHKIEYTCRREYIKPHIQEFRALIAELLHKAGIRK
jgi:hypothetical protein